MVAWPSDRSGGARNDPLLTGSTEAESNLCFFFCPIGPRHWKCRRALAHHPPRRVSSPCAKSGISWHVAAKMTRPSGRCRKAYPLASRLSTVVVHLICNQGVVGSNPTAGTNDLSEFALPIFVLTLSQRHHSDFRPLPVPGSACFQSMRGVDVQLSHAALPYASRRAVQPAVSCVH